MTRWPWNRVPVAEPLDVARAVAIAADANAWEQPLTITTTVPARSVRADAFGLALRELRTDASTSAILARYLDRIGA